MLPRSRAIVLLLVLAAVASARAAPQSTDSDLQQWLRLVEEHRPGILDRHVRDAGQWPWSRLEPVLREVQRRGLPAVLLRAAALFTDVAIHIPVEQRPQAALPGYGVMAEDGQARGRVALDSHLDAGRRLLEALAYDPSASGYPELRAHVVAWYRLVSAVLADRHNLADWRPHVVRSVARFPDEPGILFDAGAFYETFASPFMQAAMMPRELRPGRYDPEALLQAHQRSPAALYIEAEKYFRRAVERDPAYAEARVRLGRVLTLRGRASEAVRELQAAAALEADDTVKYYAFLFLGDALTGAGRTAEGSRALRSATALFPSAQSAQLALSQLAGEQGDAALAREVIGRMLEPDGHAVDRFDPWWNYYRASGRDYDATYAAFAARIRQLPAVDGEDWRIR